MKVLIISHNCFSTYTNMGKTFCSLFSRFPKEELCQLYIYPSMPDVDVCGSYYRVTDKEVLKALPLLRAPGGALDMDALEFGNSQAFEDPADAAVYKNKSNTTPAVRLLRDTMWKLSRWDSPALRRWVEQEKPTCIFLAPGYAKFIYDIALKLSREYRLPLVTYICDDYYFVKEPGTPLGDLQLSLLRRKTDRLMGNSCHLVAICQEIQDCYQDRFGIPASVIMTGSELEPHPPQPRNGNGVVLSYLGNIRLNRSRSLAAIGRELDRLSGVFLDIYTAEQDPDILKEFEGIRSIRLRGYVSGEAFRQVFENSDFLVHAEAFDEDTVDLVKHSVSTKIADCLASGVPLVAYGPGGIASMEHLRRNGCAFTATSPEELGPMLEAALGDPSARDRVLENARRTALKFHDQQANSQRLYELLRQVSDGGRDA